MAARVRAREGEFFYRFAGPGGDAPTMVHIHGFGISGSYLLPTAALLTDTFNTYVPDLPGYGRTPGPANPCPSSTWRTPSCGSWIRWGWSGRASWATPWAAR